MPPPVIVTLNSSYVNVTWREPTPEEARGAVVFYFLIRYDPVTLSALVSSVFFVKGPVPHLNIKTVFPDMGIPMLKIRQSWDRLIFNMGIHTLVRWYLYIEMAPSLSCIISTLTVDDFVM